MQRYTYDRWNVFGSPSSRDCDVFVPLRSTDGSTVMPLSIQASSDLCHAIKTDLTKQRVIPTDKPINVNVGFLDESKGVIAWVHKGTPDETNNAILQTYGDHMPLQVHSCFVTAALPRDPRIKMVRALRGILTVLSRTNRRPDVKKALKENTVRARLCVLRTIEFENVSFVGKHIPPEDAYKLIAFQIGHTLALTVRSTEVYSKERAAAMYPELAPFLHRSSTAEDLPQLTLMLRILLDQVDRMIATDPTFADEAEQVRC